MENVFEKAFYANLTFTTPSNGVMHYNEMRTLRAYNKENQKGVTLEELANHFGSIAEQNESAKSSKYQVSRSRVKPLAESLDALRFEFLNELYQRAMDKEAKATQASTLKAELAELQSLQLDLKKAALLKLSPEEVAARIASLQSQMNS
jgi:hypothetical protein